MSARFTIGLDLGGTNIKAGLADAAGRLVRKRSIPTQGSQGYRHVLERLAQAARELAAEHNASDGEIGAIGLGSPGPLSIETGVVHGAPNLPGWENVPVRDDLSRLARLPVVLDNDANLYALGEHTGGAGRGLRDLVMLTLGTGIGGGVILDGKLYRGRFGNAGEIGHVIATPGGRECPCGQRGCLERYASASAVRERFEEALQRGEPSVLRPVRHDGEPIDARDVADAAARGDALAQRVWSDACEHLATACVNLQHLLNVECVILGGGMSASGAALLDPVRARVAALTWRVADDVPRIELAALGDDAGILGAAAAAWELLRSRDR